MAYVEHDGGGSSAGVVGIFAIGLIVIVLLLLFFVHPFGIFNTTVVTPTTSGGGGTIHSTASSLPSVMASPSK